MNKFYTIKNNTGYSFNELPYLEPIMCDAQKLFLKYLEKSNMISCSNRFGGESLTVKNTIAKINPMADESWMPIIIDDELVDVVTGTRIDCVNLYNEFITINNQISIIDTCYLVESLEKNPKGIELYAAAIKNLVTLLEEYRAYSLKLREEKLEQLKASNKKPACDEYLKRILDFKVRTRSRIDETIKN